MARRSVSAGGQLGRLEPDRLEVSVAPPDGLRIDAEVDVGCAGLLGDKEVLVDVRERVDFLRHRIVLRLLGDCRWQRHEWRNGIHRGPIFNTKIGGPPDGRPNQPHFPRERDPVLPDLAIDIPES